MRFFLAAVFLIALSSSICSAESLRLNGFSIDDPLIPADAIEKGGPPRDGIPSIDAPQFVAAAEVDFLDPDDRVLGITHIGRSRAYPVRILNRHEIVNDRIDEQPVAITYCPLCGSGVAFSGIVGGSKLTFGVSGLLYNSDVLLYDRESGSLWSQIAGESINGPLKGSNLVQLPLQHTTWGDWLQRHPETQVLSTETGFAFINYDVDPYREYKRSSRLWFSVANKDKRLRNKDWVLGVTVGEENRAYPLRSLRKHESPIEDRIGGVTVTIRFDNEHRTVAALDQDGNFLQSIQLYWFAWAAFHPDTSIWNCDDGSRRC